MTGRDVQKGDQVYHQGKEWEVDIVIRYGDGSWSLFLHRVAEDGTTHLTSMRDTDVQRVVPVH